MVNFGEIYPHAYPFRNKYNKHKEHLSASKTMSSTCKNPLEEHKRRISSTMCGKSKRGRFPRKRKVSPQLIKHVFRD
jgi:hypothetical protein